MTHSRSQIPAGGGTHVTWFSRFRESFRVFLSKPLNAVSFSLTLLLCLVAILAPLLAPYAYDAVDVANGLTPPSQENLLGTDTAGRDILSRLLYGARLSLQIAIATVAFGMVVGVTIGAVAGYFGGWVDEILMRIIEVFMAVPGIVMALALVAVMGPSIPSIILALSIRRITQFARVSRGAVLTVKAMDYVAACHAMGMSHPRIIFLHILPNCMGPLIVLSSVLIGNVILTESALSFLGMGIQEPTPSIGTMIASGNEFLTFAPWISLFPGFFLLLVMLGFNLLGDGLRDHLDPRDGNLS